MKRKNKVAIVLKITSIVLFVLGLLLSVLLGVLFKTSVSTMFTTENYFNWGVVLIGIWVDFMNTAILFSLGEIINQLTNSKNMQKYYEDSDSLKETELPKI